MTTKQRLFYTAEMCLGMGSIMSLIGNLFSKGFTIQAGQEFLVWWVPTLLVAFVYNLLVASQVTNVLIKLFSNLNAGKVRSWSMIFIMCFSMCTFGIVSGGGLNDLTMQALLLTWIRSFIMAYVIRGLLVKPLAFKGLSWMKSRVMTDTESENVSGS
ncbi:hypothetical protein [Pediococcus ethanolidurans]|uniref:hypothetical protein n=1 Tax=Pediococcus ethanolidurans TaxID=319653 RepID=UPI001C1EC6A0|nr:hypothetical protein [Pediococcus ethanolidurans]MBU7555769.1 hypothetical protein [Pediococcus ethanolidurans]MBU7562746.1 hypothetical protein [Pediococcus ethanolidurans]MCT4398217.1 hypothetical protein [Pediococcus ethanolidurans]MCV3315357.1 hypothetical protein [Pediococcus ethanolidurans]MCV3321404.1 hypothetical protein [Pediococcus ethanolidurans]